MRSSLLWKVWQTQQKRPKRHAPTKAPESLNNKGEINSGPAAGNDIGASSLEIRTWIFFLSRLPCGHP